MAKPISEDDLRVKLSDIPSEEDQIKAAVDRIELSSAVAEANGATDPSAAPDWAANAIPAEQDAAPSWLAKAVPAQDAQPEWAKKAIPADEAAPSWMAKAVPADSGKPEPSWLAKALRVVATPMRGYRGLGVAAERLALGDTAGKALERGAAATEPGFVPLEGEKIGAAAGALPLYAAVGAAIPAAPVAALGTTVAAAVDGAAVGLVANAIEQKSEKDRIDNTELLFSAAGGGVLAGATAKVGSLVAARAAAKAADEAMAALNPLERGQVLQNAARKGWAQGEVQALEATKEQLVAQPSFGAKPGEGTIFQALSERITRLKDFITNATTFERAKLGVAAAVGDKAAEAAVPRLVEMSPEDRIRNVTALEKSAKPIVGASGEQTIGNVLERQARGPIEAEQSILGLKQSTKAMKETANQAILDARAGKPISIKAGQQVRAAVADALESGELSPEQAFQLMGVPNLKTTENRIQAAKLMMEMSSEYGRGLSQLSRIGATMERVFSSEDKVAAQFLAQKRAGGGIPWKEQPWTPWRALGDAYRYADDYRRAAMTSGLGTTVRNIISQGERSISGALEDAMSGMLGTITGKVPPQRALSAAATDIHSLWRAVTPAGRKEIDDMLSRFPLEKTRLLNSPIGDITLGKKAADFMNGLNIIQERFFRRAAFDGWMRNTMAQSGRGAQQLTEAEIKQGVQHALEMTYAATPPKGTFRSWILDGYRKAPILTAFGNPFPRFWINAMNRIYDMSPLPLLSQATYQAMAHPDPRVAFQAISRSTLGAGYVAAGYAAARAGYFGEKWYEVKKDGKWYDGRPYNPVIGQMAMGRILYDAKHEGKWALLKMTPEDWSQMVLSMKRTDATGVPLLDIVFARSGAELQSDLIKTMSDYIGSFAPRFLASARDLSGVVRPEARVPRYTQEKPITGQLRAQFPFWSDQLPARPSPMRPGYEERIDPVQRTLGLGARIKTPVEAEADRLGLRPRNIYPHTKNPEYDRLIVEEMGPMLSVALENLRVSDMYQHAPTELKKHLFELYINVHRNAMKFKVGGMRDDLIKKYMEDSRADWLKAVMEQRAQEAEMSRVREEQQGVLEE